MQVIFGKGGAGDTDINTTDEIVTHFSAFNELSSHGALPSPGLKKM